MIKIMFELKARTEGIITWKYHTPNCSISETMKRHFVRIHGVELLLYYCLIVICMVDKVSITEIITLNFPTYAYKFI